MNLKDIITRVERPEPWAEGDNIPWHDPAFSERMLREHISQAHDAASRRSEIIDRQVAWIHRKLLSERPARILDLGCGPGLYAYRLAARGHTCTGIDYSPASIAHARRSALERRLDIRYEHEDIRTAAFPPDQDLVQLLFGELNVFSRSDARGIIAKAAESLKPSGRMILEVHAKGVIERLGKAPRTWYSAASGLWSDRPHLCLQENFWYPDRNVAVTRYFVTDAATGETSLFSASYQDHSDDEYDSLLIDCGFGSISRYPSLTGTEGDGQENFAVLVAEK